MTAASMTAARFRLSPASAVIAAMGLILAPFAGAQTPAIPTNATHLFIYDATTKAPLYCYQCDVPMAPASMSKLMTVYLVLEKIKSGALKWDTMLTVSENAWRHGAQSDGSHMFLALGSQVSVRDLLQGVIIVSANDGCVALAEGISGSEEAFVAEMNAEAKRLGLSSAHFANASGLPDPNHLISARDLAKLAELVIEESPEIYKYYSTETFTYNNHTQENRNPLLGHFPGADGVKTGHSDESGYGLIGSAVQNGERRIIVFNGLTSKAERSAEALRLMRVAFAEFKSYALFEAGEKVAEAEVFQGQAAAVSLVAPQKIAATLHFSARGAMKVRVIYDAPIAAPIVKGAIVARLEVEAPGIGKVSFPLAAGEAVKRKGAFARALGALTGS